MTNLEEDLIVNIDNQSLLLHKDNLSKYLLRRSTTPITVEVDPTISCNHRCPNCTFANVKAGNRFLSRHIEEKILQGLEDSQIKGMIISGGGEPCMYGRLGEFVESVCDLGVDITLTTNGQLIHKHFYKLMNGLKRIRFSIDAASPKSFQLTHGMTEKDYNQVIENLHKAVTYKRKNSLEIDIGVSFLICEQNYLEVKSAIQMYETIGVDFLHFKPMQYWDRQNKRYYYKAIPGIEKIFSTIGGYRSRDFKVSYSRENYYKAFRPDITYAVCHGAFFDVIIGADGKAYTCCHFKYNPKYCYGNLNKDNMIDIICHVRADVTRECFPNCKMDALNQFVEYAVHHQDEILELCQNLRLSELPIGSKWL